MLLRRCLCAVLVVLVVSLLFLLLLLTRQQLLWDGQFAAPPSSQDVIDEQSQATTPIMTIPDADKPSVTPPDQPTQDFDQSSITPTVSPPQPPSPTPYTTTPPTVAKNFYYPNQSSGHSSEANGDDGGAHTRRGKRRVPVFSDLYRQLRRLFARRKEYIDKGMKVPRQLKKNIRRTLTKWWRWITRQKGTKRVKKERNRGLKLAKEAGYNVESLISGKNGRRGKKGPPGPARGAISAWGTGSPQQQGAMTYAPAAAQRPDSTRGSNSDGGASYSSNGGGAGGIMGTLSGMAGKLGGGAANDYVNMGRAGLDVAENTFGVKKSDMVGMAATAMGGPMAGAGARFLAKQFFGGK